MLLYADDIKIYAAVNDVDSQMSLQGTLTRVVSHIRSLRLTVSVSKTSFTSFYPKNSKRFASHYKIDATELQRGDQVRDLGITFDKHLTFLPNIEAIRLRTLNMAGLLLRFVHQTKSRNLTSARPYCTML